MTKAQEPDFRVENHGSIFLLRPLTKEARNWSTAHLPEDVCTFGNAVAVEPRYISNIVEGIINDGLVVS